MYIFKCVHWEIILHINHTQEHPLLALIGAISLHSLVQSEHRLQGSPTRNHITSYCSDNFTPCQIYCDHNRSRSARITTKRIPTNILSLRTRILWCGPAIGAELSFTFTVLSPGMFYVRQNHHEHFPSTRITKKDRVLIGLLVDSLAPQALPSTQLVSLSDSSHLQMTKSCKSRKLVLPPC